MFTGINWTTDVLPLITAEAGSSLIKGALATIAMISVVAYGARSFLGVFHKRD